jgi:hypothetical protein
MGLAPGQVQICTAPEFFHSLLAGPFHIKLRPLQKSPALAFLLKIERRRPCLRLNRVWTAYPVPPQSFAPERRGPYQVAAQCPPQNLSEDA